MVAKIQGAQRDFSFGEVDVALKRADEHPARKSGLRQMVNARILNSGAVQDRSGRRALFPITNACTRFEKITMSAGHNFKIGFGNARLQIVDNTETVVLNVTTTGGGAALPWTTATLKNAVFAVFGLTIIITFPGMRPQVVTWDGVTTWSRADFTELVIGNQKRTPFYKISPQGVGIVPSAQTGAITISASAPLFTSTGGISNTGHVGTRIRFVGRQILITGVTNPTLASGTVEEALPGGQTINFAVDPSAQFSLGDEVIGSVTGSKGLVVNVNGAGKLIQVQLLAQSTATGATTGFAGSNTLTGAFSASDVIEGPAGALANSSVSAIVAPLQQVTIWDDEVMNDFRGYPASCFTDQFRVGFTNFPSLPSGVSWSAINNPTDLYVGANPSDAMFEIAPGKSQVYYVVPGPESSEFVFCDNRIYYIPISPTNPLKPGSVAFQTISADGAGQVQPRLAQEAILYANAGQSSMMAVIATGAYNRPFNTKNLSDYHFHLFNGIVAIAAPSADGTFNERYAYVLNGDGSIAVGKYDPASLQGNQPVIGWGPWSGAGTVNWIAAWNADIFFTSSYFGSGIFEVLDDTVYLDCNVAVNALPTAFTPPGGKGPLYLIAAGQSVTLIDQGTRFMGTYQVDANGNITPQFNGGEDLTLASLMAGQPWTMTVEPFCPDASPGQDVGQRMFPRRVARFAAYVIHSTGFTMARLFSGKITPATQAAGITLGTVMNNRRFPAWNVGDDPTKPPPQRETVERTRPIGRSYDPRVAVIKDTPGPMTILELGLEATI